MGTPYLKVAELEKILRSGLVKGPSRQPPAKEKKASEKKVLKRPRSPENPLKSAEEVQQEPVIEVCALPSTSPAAKSGEFNDYKKKNALASMQNVSHDGFAQGQPAGQADPQNVAYQGNGDPALAAAGGAAS